MIIAVVPAYNESKTIAKVVSGLIKTVDKVVVVDDCSGDNTGELAQAVGAIVLRHEINRGQGAALQTGHTFALKLSAEYVVDFDADDQLDSADILPSLDYLKKQSADILFGSRFLDQRSQVPWLKRIIILPVGRLLNWFLTGIKLSDAHMGFRILNKQALEKIIITQDKMAHASEILLLVKKHRLKYVEFPVKVYYHEYGQKAAEGFKIVKDLFMGRFVK